MATTSATVGINAEGVNKIIEAIKTYKINVTKAIDVSVTDKVIQAAVKGLASEAAIKAATAELNKAIVDFLNFVDKYEGLLTKTRENYKSHDSNVTFNFQK